MTIKNFTVFDNNNNIKFFQDNIKNTLHQTGEQYMLNALFRQGEISPFYYAGLDNRPALSVTDTISSINGEPSLTTSYRRQKIESWEIPSILNGIYVVKSGYIKFNANTTAWGPVGNIFLTTENSGGILISSVKLVSPVTLAVGDSVTMFINLSLFN